MVKILKDEQLPADIILMKSEKENGVVYVDTMNLDGEVKWPILIHLDKFERKDSTKGVHWY